MCPSAFFNHGKTDVQKLHLLPNTMILLDYETTTQNHTRPLLSSLFFSVPRIQVVFICDIGDELNDVRTPALTLTRKVCQLI